MEDARGRSGGGGSLGRGMGGVGMSLIGMIGRKFGIKGILVAGLAFLVLWKCGVDPSMLLGGAPSITSNAPAKVSPQEEEQYQFVGVVLKQTERRLDRGILKNW